MDAAETIFKAVGAIVGLAVIFGFLLYCCISDKEHDKVIYEQGYLQACKDCADGKPKYDLKEVPGGERIWVKRAIGDTQSVAE